MADSELISIAEDTTPDLTDYMYGIDSAGNTDKRYSIANLGTTIRQVRWELVDQDFALVTSGDITLNSTTIANLTATQLTLSGAATGDVVWFGMDGLLSSVAQTKAFDAYTFVTGTRTNAFGVGVSNSLATTAGHSSWYGRAVAEDVNISGTATRTLVGGDISGGNVVVGVAYAGSTSTARTLYASANNPLHVRAQLWRPAV